MLNVRLRQCIRSSKDWSTTFWAAFLSKPFRVIVLQLTLGLSVLFALFVFYRYFSLDSASSWKMTLDIRTEVTPNNADTELLTIHVMSENRSDKTINFDNVHAAYRLAVREVPKGLLEHAFLDVRRGKLIADKNFMPAIGWTSLPHAISTSTFSIVLSKGSRVAIEAELTRDDEFVKTGKFVHIAP